MSHSGSGAAGGAKKGSVGEKGTVGARGGTRVAAPRIQGGNAESKNEDGQRGGVGDGSSVSSSGIGAQEDEATEDREDEGRRRK